MRHYLIILLALAGLAGHGLAVAEQPAGSVESATSPAGQDPQPATGKDPEQPQAGKQDAGKKKAAGAGEEPDCE